MRCSMSPPWRTVRTMAPVLLALFLKAPVQAQTWGSSGFDLWTLPGAAVSNFSPINNSGRVAGTAFNPASGLWEAAIFDRSSTTFLGTQAGNSMAGASSSGNGINNVGGVTGSIQAYNGADRAFRYGNGVMHDLGPVDAGSNVGRGINDAGQVTGSSTSMKGTQTAFRSNVDGSLQGLGTLGGSSSSGRGINSTGQVTGHSVTGTGHTHAFRYGAGGMEDLGALDAVFSFSVGYGINDAGQVTGVSVTSAGRDHAFRYGAGGMEDLGALGGISSRGYGIDNTGRVAGSANGATGRRAAFWEGSTGYFLDAIVGGGWTFTEARGISDDGRYIVAVGSHSNYNGTAFSGHVVLAQSVPPSSTVPEPVSVALLGTGLAGVAGAARRRRRKEQEAANA